MFRADVVDLGDHLAGQVAVGAFHDLGDEDRAGSLAVLVELDQTRRALEFEAGQGLMELLLDVA